jgi:transposase
MQQYYAVADDEPMRWREADDSPPAGKRIHTPYDVEARYGAKRATTWTGYKAHITETCDGEDKPHLITHVVTTEATAPERVVVPEIHSALDEKELLPTEHLLDAGYVDSETMVTSQNDHCIEVIGPVPKDQSWQAQAKTGFDVTYFIFDWENKVATCPQGSTSRKWSETHDRNGNPIINIRFDANVCKECASRQQCTRSARGARNMTVRPRAQHKALQTARKYQETEEFQERYQTRAGVEGTISQGVRASTLRRSRYVGLAKTHLQHVLIAAAINLRRVGEWLLADDMPRAKTRTAPFVTLAQTAAC